MRFDVGQTSKAIPRSRTSSTSAGSSSTLMPCPIRSAPSASMAPRIDAGPTVSPAWGME
jgi:hypothetical protein